MRLILVRHGETWFNQVGLTQGWCDSPLTEKGQAQARRLKELLADMKGLTIRPASCWKAGIFRWRETAD